MSRPPSLAQARSGRGAADQDRVDDAAELPLVPSPSRTLIPARLARLALPLLRRGVVGLIVFLVVGNAAILAASTLAATMVDGPTVPGVEGVPNLRVVDPKVWRGGAPSKAGYEALRAAGVATVVDLRAEDDARDRDPMIEALGLRVVHLPIRDGQLPTPEQVDIFFAVVANSPGKVFLHCGAGVGRTGAMAAAYLVGTGQATGEGALLRNLEVGPPTLEQMVYAFDRGAGAGRPNLLVTASSRVLDAPRRLWHNLR